MTQVWTIIISILQALWLPFIVYFGAGATMILASGHRDVDKQWKESRTLKNRTALYMRWKGYDTNDVAELWGALDARARRSERRFLQLDLFFPFFYGGSFLVALMQVWTELGKPFSLVWIIAPVLLTAIADWTENLTQLGQLGRFVVNGKAGLQAERVQTASTATVVKLFSFIFGLLAFLIGLAIWRGVQMAK